MRETYPSKKRKGAKKREEQEELERRMKSEMEN